jgi:hypothetical protein
MLDRQSHQSRGIASSLTVFDAVSLDPLLELVCKQRARSAAALQTIVGGEITMSDNDNSVRNAGRDQREL